MINRKDDRKGRLVLAGRLYGRIALATLLLLTTILLQGCIIAAAVAGTIAVIIGTSSHTATVEVEKTPAEVYSAMLSVVEKTSASDVKINKRDDDKHRLKISRGKNIADVRVKLNKKGKTILTVTASAGEKDKKHKDLALDIVEIICHELGVKYKIVEKKWWESK